MAVDVRGRWSEPEDYDAAVEAAGVTELPELPAPTGRALSPELAGGRWEDSKPPGVSE